MEKFSETQKLIKEARELQLKLRKLQKNFTKYALSRNECAAKEKKGR